ncbi:MAG: 3-mercaptopyruvate sulfurtransferase [Hyphomicrobiales bacterium]|nr:3-mercaptopyruvate sulfurtransferase [Hyphomicrobiales bacterium]
MEREHFITPDALNRHLGDQDLSIICNFMTMPGDDRDGHEEFRQERIPGAVYFDIDRIADQTSNLPHMIADSEHFSTLMGELGVSENDDIIVYDGPGLFSSARIWWNLRLMGARNVRVLEGGFMRWKKGYYPIESKPPNKPDPVSFNVELIPQQVISSSQLLDLVNEGNGTILDARSLARFNGTADEPRKGLLLGHMPGAISLPFTQLIDDGSLISNDRLRQIFEPLLTNGGPIVTTCGSGVTAAVLSLALTCAGYDSHRLFDGSWTEWGDQESDFPIINIKDNNYA